jgi:hypothetical protein
MASVSSRYSGVRIFDVVDTPTTKFFRNLVFLMLFLDPWEHLLFMGIGAFSANKLIEWEQKQSAELDAMLADIGRPTTARE